MLNLFTQFLDDEDINAIRETFQAMDEDNSGLIEIEELEKAFDYFKIDEFYNQDMLILTNSVSVVEKYVPRIVNMNRSGSVAEPVDPEK